MKIPRRLYIKQAVLTIYHYMLILVNINFVKGKKSFKENHCVHARISSLRVSQVYLGATYRCDNLCQIARAWDGTSRHPLGALQAWASALQAQKGYVGFHTQKIFVCGEMIKFRMSIWVNQNSNILNQNDITCLAVCLKMRT